MIFYVLRELSLIMMCALLMNYINHLYLSCSISLLFLLVQWNSVSLNQQWNWLIFVESHFPCIAFSVSMKKRNLKTGYNLNSFILLQVSLCIHQSQASYVSFRQTMLSCSKVLSLLHRLTILVEFAVA